MRKALRSTAPVLLALLSGALILVWSVMTPAVERAATALIVPGTGTADPDNLAEFIQNAQDYYLGGTPCNRAAAGCQLEGVTYPAALWPFHFGPTNLKYGPSVALGVEHLNSEFINQLQNPDHDGQPIVIFGFSQGSNVVSNELYNLATLNLDNKSRLSVVVTGNTQRPAGGIWTRLGPLGNIPILEIPLGHPTTA